MMFRRYTPAQWGLIVLAGVLAAAYYISTHPSAPSPKPQPVSATLAEVRKNFHTKLTRSEHEDEPVPQPPQGLFDVVKYPSPVGDLEAYLSPDPKDGKQHPALIWIFGGFNNSIGPTAWANMPAKNDQSARAFREAGIIMMDPSFRGGNKNPGVKEAFLGEVDDVLAAADFLAKQPWVDPQRIYLGGHSTGGTMAMLAAESSDRFRAVFACGPVGTVAVYGEENLPFDGKNLDELTVRAPVGWLKCVKRPLFVFEGRDMPGNAAQVDFMKTHSTNPQIQFHLVAGATHFSILAPVTKLVADRVLHDDGPTVKINFTDDELNAAMKQ